MSEDRTGHRARSETPHRLARVLGKRAILGAVAGVGCALAMNACGSDDDQGTIPQDQGTQIIALLDQLEQRVEDGSCDAAQATATEIGNRIQALPEQVDGELRRTLVTASGRLAEQTRTQCEEEPEKPEEPLPPTDPTGVTGETGSLEEDEG
jgi:hypothetical protein